MTPFPSFIVTIILRIFDACFRSGSAFVLNRKGTRTSISSNIAAEKKWKRTNTKSFNKAQMVTAISECGMVMWIVYIVFSESSCKKTLGNAPGQEKPHFLLPWSYYFIATRLVRLFSITGSVTDRSGLSTSWIPSIFLQILRQFIRLYASSEESEGQFW